MALMRNKKKWITESRGNSCMRILKKVQINQMLETTHEHYKGNEKLKNYILEERRHNLVNKIATKQHQQRRK